jgi:hypothetical protein
MPSGISIIWIGNSALDPKINNSTFAFRDMRQDGMNGESKTTSIFKVYLEQGCVPFVMLFIPHDKLQIAVFLGIVPPGIRSDNGRWDPTWFNQNTTFIYNPQKKDNIKIIYRLNQSDCIKYPRIKGSVEAFESLHDKNKNTFKILVQLFIIILLMIILFILP